MSPRRKRSVGPTPAQPADRMPGEAEALPRDDVPSPDIEALVDSWLVGPAEITAEPEAVDPEIVAGFVVESIDALAEAEHAALSLESRPDDAESVHSIFRCFHTIKGTSSFLDLDRISRFAHDAESLLARIRDGTLAITPEAVDLVIRSIDALTQWIRAVERDPHIVPPGIDELTADLHSAGTQTTVPHAQADTTPAANAHAAPVTAAGDAWTRVRTDRLDRLLEAIGELLVTHAIVAREASLALDTNSDLAQTIVHNGKIVRSLQDLGMSMRMVPLRPVLQKLSRQVRDLSRKSGKPVDFITEGDDVELDRNMVELLHEPLVHMIRNAIDHGVESPERRRAAGKQEVAKLTLRAAHSGSNIVIELADDGRGLDTERIRSRALARGLIRDDRAASDGELHELIFAPAFSTVEEVTSLSGRGVGMDVVRRNLEALNGHVEVHSTPGQGCRFRLILPLTLAIMEGMLVRVGPEHYLVPVINIQQSFRPASGALRTVGERAEMVVLRDEMLPVIRLHRLFGIEGAEERPEHAVLVVVAAAERRSALLVDALVGQQQVVTRAMTGISRAPGVSGAAILGDGHVGLILDIAEINTLARSGTPA